MCGISGHASKNSAAADTARVRQFVEQLKHRGPDEQDVAVLSGAALGFTRLSMVGLTNGHQPLPNEDSSMWLVANGEIYNHRALRRELETQGQLFRTDSDCEVILHLFARNGIAGLGRLVGMFAFAIWDERQQTLYLGRDRSGIKPLHYALTENGLFFASELRPLIASGAVRPELDQVAVHQFFSTLCVFDSRSIFKSVSKVQPGEVLTYRRGSLSRERFCPATDFSRTDDSNAAGADDTAAVSAVRQKLIESVLLTAQCDAPIGVLLSGGLDSSSICASLAASGTKLPAYSVAFAEEEFDERRYSSLIAAHFGLRHELCIFSADQAAGLASELTAHFDEPYADCSSLALAAVARTARADVKALISGEGGDELFAGYPWHLSPPGAGAQLDDYAQARGRAIFGTDLRSALLTPDLFAPDTTPGFDSWGVQLTAGSALGRSLEYDENYYLRSDLLPKLDRTLMLYSIEGRVPFLNHPFADFARALPQNLKIRDGVQKFILRTAFADLPQEILAKPKQGFSIPLDIWMWKKGPFRDLIFDTLRPESMKSSHLFQTSYISQLADAHLRLQQFHGYRLWTLFVFERWYQQIMSAD